MVEPLNLANFGGHQFRCPTRLFDGLPWFGQFDLLEAFGCDQESDALACQRCCHDCLLYGPWVSGRIPMATGGQSGLRQVGLVDGELAALDHIAHPGRSEALAEGSPRVADDHGVRAGSYGCRTGQSEQRADLPEIVTRGRDAD